MCTDADYSALNTLSVPEGKEEAPVLTMEFGPYMN